MKGWYFVVPLLSAIGGWLAFLLVIRIIFKSVLTGHRHELAEQLAKLINVESLSPVSIGQVIASPQNLRQVRPIVEKHADQFLQSKLKSTFPVLNVFIGGKTVKQLKHIFVEELEQVFPIVIEKTTGSMKNGRPPETVIAQQLLAIPSGSLQQIFQETLSKELKIIQLIGSLFGLLIGILSVCLAIFLPS